MKTLLYIKGSPRTERSASSKGAEAFLLEYRKHNPDTKIEILDLWEVPLPEFNEDAVTARYKVFRDIQMTDAEASAWNAVSEFTGRFMQADEYLFSVPMWNFSIPYRIKNFIDIVTQPHITFEVTDAGYAGLLKNKKACVVFSSGGTYDAPETAPYDHCRPYFKGFLNFIGITDIQVIDIPGTMYGADVDLLIKNAIKDIF